MVDGPSRVHKQEIIPSVRAIVPSEKTGRRNRVHPEDKEDKEKRKEYKEQTEEGTGHKVDIMA